MLGFLLVQLVCVPLVIKAATVLVNPVIKTLFYMDERNTFHGLITTQLAQLVIYFLHMGLG